MCRYQSVMLRGCGCACPAQVLGRSEFKQLLRWRLTLRKELKGDLAVAEEAAGKAKGKDKKGEKGAGCIMPWQVSRVLPIGRRADLERSKRRGH